MIGIKCRTRTPLLLERFLIVFRRPILKALAFSTINHGIGSSENRAYESLFLASLGMKKDHGHSQVDAKIASN